MALNSDELLRSLVPLKVVILTENAGVEQVPIVAAVRRAFSGGSESVASVEAYFAGGEDLGVTVLDGDFGKDPVAAQRILDDARASALHVLVVAVLLERPQGALQTVLQQLDWDSSNEDSDGRVLLMPIMLREGIWSGDTQALNFVTLGEYAIRPVYAAANALSCAWRLLGEPRDKLKLFISHAKLDGLPLAESCQFHFGKLHGLENFYDAKDIAIGSNWRKELRDGVESSAIVALRTDIYEDRAWCVQELDWAEDFGSPVVVVEARTHLVRTREFLPIGGSPCVYVPDGNMVRILQAAMREALRVKLFARQVVALERAGALQPRESLRVPRSSLATIGLRCQDESDRRAKQGASASPVRQVLVPEKLRESHRRVALKLVGSWFPEAWFGTPKDFVNKCLESL